MKSISIIAIGIISVLAISSCKKASGDQSDPTITMNHPMAGASFVNGDTMHLHLDFGDETNLHDVNVTITKNGTVDYEHSHHVDATSHSHHDDYVISVTDHTDFDVRAEAEDHAGNTTELTRSYHVHP